MENHWMEKRRTEELRPLLTLIVEKINMWGYLMGAHRNKNWHTNKHYDHAPKSNTYRMQGTLDRIAKVEYHIVHHTDNTQIIPHAEICNRPILGPDIYDHSITLHWKELFGMGTPDDELAESLKTIYLQDSVGSWHAPCDQTLSIFLYHPSKQKTNERVMGCWDKLPGPRWRPEYNYTEKEVEEALKIMCKEFDWEYECT